MTQEQIKQLREEIIDALHDSMDSDDNSVDITWFDVNLNMVLEATFNTEEEMRADKEGYHLRTLRYYGDGGIVNEIHGFVKLIAIHGGGNYGLAEQYDIVNSEGRYKLQYYGDSSAKVTKYETFNTQEK